MTPKAPIGLSQRKPILKTPTLVKINTVSTSSSAIKAAQKTRSPLVIFFMKKATRKTPSITP